MFFFYLTGHQEALDNYHQISKEMKMLLLLFAIEHFIFCIPLFVLSFNISKRNEYLSQDFPLRKLYFKTYDNFSIKLHLIINEDMIYSQTCLNGHL